MLRTVFLSLWGIIAVSASLADTIEFHSPASPPAIIELFTSEGCSSCPPAERWLNGFVAQPGLWKDVFPMAWHVDYWDSLGWPDRFAESAFSQRQRRYQRQTPLRSVYTPGVLVNGKAWRGWVRNHPLEPPTEPGTGPLVVTLDQGKFEARLQALGHHQAGRKLVLQMAVLGFDLTTAVKRGENTGKSLAHEFVVLDFKSLGLGAGQWLGLMPDLTELRKNSDRLAVVFWVESERSPVPLQIAGGWLQEF